MGIFIKFEERHTVFAVAQKKFMGNVSVETLVTLSMGSN